jgi:protein phosphatase
MSTQDPAQEGNELRRILSTRLRIDSLRPLSALVRVEFGAHSRAGVHGQANEDHFLTMRLGRYQEVLATSLPADDLPSRFEEFGFAMFVANGLGESGTGALASRVALSTIAHLAIHHGNWNLRIDPATAESVMERAVWLYERAARAVDRHSESMPALMGMGTSLTAAFSAGDQLFYAHVGSSRAYMFRQGELTQLTRDHTLDQRVYESGGPVPVPQGSQGLRELLTEVVGGGRGLPDVDVERFGLYDQDLILICSRGVCDTVDDDAIADVLAQIRRPSEQCQRLTELAVTRGAEDDATALVAKYALPNSYTAAEP